MTYDPEHFFLISLDIPAGGEIFHAGRQLPFTALALTLNIDVIVVLVASSAANPLPVFLVQQDDQLRDFIVLHAEIIG